MAKPKAEHSIESKKLDMIIDLLRQSVAVELFDHEVSKGSIARQLHVAKATVVSMLKGVKKGEE